MPCGMLLLLLVVGYGESPKGRQGQKGKNILL